LRFYLFVTNTINYRESNDFFLEYIKSTFLAAVTRAKPRIADYPFTTVVPNLGTWIPGDMSDINTNRNKDGERGREKERAAGSNGLVLCDVPGLIAGASEGVGLGHAFLRHIERCRVILHLIDATGDDPVGDLAMVNDELRRYGSGSLAKKPQVVIVNKIDAAWEGLEDEEEIKKKREELADKIKEEIGHTRLMWISAKEKDGVDGLMTRMASYVGTIKEEQGNEVIQ
jgi:GTP-binding protein